MSIFVNARFLTQEMTGVQRYAIEMSKRLRSLSGDIRFVSPRNIIHPGLARELNVVEHGRMSGHLWEQIELPAFLKKMGSPLLINMANSSPLRYRNKVVVIHDAAFMRNPGWFSKKFFYYYKFVVVRAAREALKVIAPSEFSKKEIHEMLKIPEERIEVVYGAASEAPPDGEGEGRSRGRRYMLAVSSLDPRKNFEKLAEAFIASGLRDLSLIIVGSGNSIFRNRKMKEAIGSNPDIIFTGYIQDRELFDLYRGAELFIYPSLYEGFGMPPLEAMACGCPVIVSRVSSLPEICGDAAFYVDPLDIGDMKKAMCEVAGNAGLRRELAIRGRERAKLFSWDESAERLLKIVRGVANN